MTWSRMFLLWVAAIVTGITVGSVLGAMNAIVYQAGIPGADLFAPLILMTSAVTAAVGGWSGFVAGLVAVLAIALFDRRLRLPARRRNLMIGAAAGIGGYVALLAFYAGPSNLESPWTFVGLSAAIAATGCVSATLCGNRASRLLPGPTRR